MAGFRGAKPTVALYAVPAAISLALIGLAFSGRLDPWETFGFVTGAWGVWLQVRESVWNWPVQLISSAVYIVVFYRVALFSDTLLNVLYVGLYVAGWYWWLRGGERRQPLWIHRTTAPIALGLLAATAIGTVAWTPVLASHHDSAPLLDAFTTLLSLAALLMTARKLFESWWVWIVANLVFVGLYAYKGLWLTAVLYAVFTAMSVAGLLNWRRLLRRQGQPAAEPAALADQPSL